jgi:hypothetical protein
MVITPATYQVWRSKRTGEYVVAEPGKPFKVRKDLILEFDRDYRIACEWYINIAIGHFPPEYADQRVN